MNFSRFSNELFSSNICVTSSIATGLLNIPAHPQQLNFFFPNEERYQYLKKLLSPLVAASTSACLSSILLKLVNNIDED